MFTPRSLGRCCGGLRQFRRRGLKCGGRQYVKVIIELKTYALSFSVPCSETRKFGVKGVDVSTSSESLPAQISVINRKLR